METVPPKGSGPYRIYSASSLGDAIRHYREQADLTQAQLADELGLPRSYLSELEQGKETEQLARILQALRFLGVRITLDKADWWWRTISMFASTTTSVSFPRSDWDRHSVAWRHA